MVLLTNKYQYHNLMLENFLDEWVTKKRPDVVLHSNDGHNFKVYVLFVTSKIEFSKPQILEFKRLQKAFLIKKKSKA